MNAYNNNCQIPTPVEYARIMLDYAGYRKNLYGQSVLENSCGKGNILCEVVRRYINDAEAAGYSKAEVSYGLERDIEAFEVDNDKFRACIISLNDILYEKDIPSVNWNIHNCDYLKSRIKKYKYIIGNPPYITYHDMTDEQRKYLKKEYYSCKIGRFDYCYAFIEKSLQSLENGGILVYLVPYSIMNNKYGAELRRIIQPYVASIYDYRGIRIFQNAITSSIMLLCRKQDKCEYVEYFAVKDRTKQKYYRDKLNEKWTFGSHDNAKKRKFGDYFEVKNSVATLLNDAFLLEDYDETEDYIVIKKHRIEKEITYPAISTKSLKKNKDKRLLIIFPYLCENGVIRHYSDEEFQKKYPNAYIYLQSYVKKLNARKKDKNSEWFEYGRSQAINSVFGNKLIMPMVITKSVNVSYGGYAEIPYAGYFIKCRDNSGYDLDYAKKILESKEFYKYVVTNGTPTTPASYRISVNDVKEYRF